MHKALYLRDDVNYWMKRNKIISPRLGLIELLRQGFETYIRKSKDMSHIKQKLRSSEQKNEQKSLKHKKTNLKTRKINSMDSLEEKSK